jgi:hypothetical protein
MIDNELDMLLEELRNLDLRTTKSKSKTNLDELLNLSDIVSSEKDLTLSEYLKKHEKFSDLIDDEKERKAKDHGYEELFKILDGDSESFIEKRIDEDFEYRAVKTLFAKNARSDEEVKSKDIFLNQSKERCNNVYFRIKPYSNTKSTLTLEAKMSPLQLKRYQS